MTISRKLPQYIVFFIGTLFFSILAVTGITFGISAIAGVVDGSLDPYFQNGKYGGFNDVVDALAVQPDGKILVGGRFTDYKGTTCNFIARLNTDGSLDTTFNIGTGFNQDVREITIQSDGKILVGGSFDTYNGTSYSHIIRLNADGSPDTSFNTDTISGGNREVYSLALQEDNKILVGGSFESIGSYARRSVARINADGTLDTSFDSSLDVGNGVFAFAPLSDGKIIVGGSFWTYNGVSCNGIIKINEDGSTDETFILGAGVSMNGNVKTLEIQTDGKILVGGLFASFNEISRNGIVRLQEDGEVDTTFDPGPGFDPGNGSNFYNAVYDIKILSNGMILAGGSFISFGGVSRNGIVKMQSDGSLNSSFDNGIGTDADVHKIGLQSNGRIIIAGEFKSYNGTATNYLAEINSDGSLSTEFDLGSNTGFNNEVYAIATQSDGKILVGGDFTVFNNIARNYIARLNEDGTLDTSFIQEGSGFNNGIISIALQGDGKILVSGYFTSYNGVAVRNLVRLNSNGTLDTTFVIFGELFDGQWNYPNNIIVQSDGTILICGEFEDGDYTYVVLKLQSDGSVDESFAQNSLYVGGSVESMAIQSDGKILIAGYLWGNEGERYLMRLNNDGSPDSTFSIVGEGFDNVVRFVTTQSDGKILVGGEFGSYDSVPIKGVVRLNSDGTLDTSFNLTGYENNEGAYAISVQSDGKIFVGGYFWDGEYEATNISSLVRLNSDGSLDSSFDNSGIGGDSWPKVGVIKIQLDGKVLVGGYFLKYNNESVTFLTRLGFTDILPPTGGVAINSNANSTTNRNVTLTLGAADNLSDVSQMMICNNSSFTGCTWQSYTTTKAWTLDTGLGVKTIYVKYKDGVNLESQVYTDTIRLIAPTVVVPAETVVETPSQPIEVIPTPEIVTTVIQILDNNGEAIVGARVEIEGNLYVTDTNGRIQVQGSTKGKSYSAKISYNGKTYTHEVLGSSDNEKKIVLDAGQADVSTSEQYSFEWKKALLYGSIIIASIIGIVTFTQVIKKKKNL